MGHFFVYRVAANDTTNDCISHCDLDCQTTDFVGSVSFSQISSQATDKLLGTLGDDILAKYIAATELANRMTPDASLIEYLSQLSSQSVLVTSYVRKVIALQELYSQGVAKFSDEVVRYDTTVLSDMLVRFVNLYTTNFASYRSIAVQRLATAVTLLQNLNSELTQPQPSSTHSKLEYFTDAADRQTFYAGIYALLGNCLYAVRQSLLYINLVVDNEHYLGTNSPKIFYTIPSTQVKCVSHYAFVTSVLQNLQKRLSFAYDRVFRWLQENIDSSASCASAPSSTAESVTEATQSVANTGEPSDAIPGMANLLACGTTESESQVIYDWTNITSLLTTDIVSDITTCLNEYQTSLNNAYTAATTTLPDLPQLSATSALTAALAQLDSDNAKFTLAANSYISGNMTKQKLGTSLTALARNMSVDIDSISQSVTDMINQWQTNLTLWTSNITAVYTNIISTLSTLKIYLSNSESSLIDDVTLTGTISKLRMWCKPSIQLQPALKVIYANDMNETFALVKKIQNFFLQNTAKFQMTVTMSKILSYNTQQCQALSSQMQTMSSVWGSIKSDVSDLLTGYISKLVLNDIFTGYCCHFLLNM
jgi:hypothetical protein